MRTKDGSWRWFRGRFRVWPDDQGRAAVLVGALYDGARHVVALALQTGHHDACSLGHANVAASASTKTLKLGDHIRRT